MPHRLLLGRLRQLRLTILPDRSEHDIASGARFGRSDQQILIDQIAHQIDGLHPGGTVAVEELDGAFERERPGNDGEPAEEPLLFRAQQHVTPADGAAKGAMPVGRVPRSAGQQIETAGQELPNLVQRKMPHPGRRQLDRQRQIIELLHDRGDPLQRRPVGLEGGIARARPLDEQANGRMIRQLFVTGADRRERADAHLSLTDQPQRHPAGDQQR